MGFLSFFFFNPFEEGEKAGTVFRFRICLCKPIQEKTNGGILEFFFFSDLFFFLRLLVRLVY